MSGKNREGKNRRWVFCFSLVVKVPADLLHLFIFGEGINLEIGLKILLTWLEYFFPVNTMEVKITFMDWQRKGKTSFTLPVCWQEFLEVVST